MDFRFHINKRKDKIARHVSRALNQDERLQSLDRVIDYTDALVEQMFPKEILDLFGINLIEISNALAALLNSRVLTDEYESIREDIQHFQSIGGRNNSNPQLLDPTKEPFYLIRMIDIEKQINDIRELLYEKYNKEKFMNFIAQKENQLLIHTFMQFLYDDIHKF